jgi:phenylalanyl-tRNA synthetase beta chain
MSQEFDDSTLIQIANPVSKEYNTTRISILPNLMDTIRFNRSEEKPIRLFEVGDVVLLATKEETGAKREIHLSAVSYHEDADFTEIRSALDFIMTALGLFDEFEIMVGSNPSYINGRYGDIYLKGSKIGEIGEINPEVLLNFKLEFPVAALELNLEKIL